ncbi:MAG: VWA domain-containing protein, partial [Trueperaceae bacterium]|nr:VWA domain-containing protein [Trueperaceae bacterium]
MNLTFAAPAFLALLAALPLVVWWHLRRLRHRPRPMAALFLWDEARRAASTRRRWRPTWSLLLQLLAVAAAALALAQPSIDRLGPPDLVVVLDAGARMMAVDPEGRRLDRARAAVLELTADAGAVALVRAGAVPELALPFTADRAALRGALDAFQAVDAGVDVEAALDLARALSDGRVAWVSDDPGPARADVLRVGVAGSGHNVGIVAFDLGIQQAFVAVASDQPRPVSVGVVLERQGGGLVARTELLVPANGRATTTFPVDVVGDVVVARLEVSGTADALALDDVAYAGRRALEVVMDLDEERVRRGLAAVPGTEVTVTGAAA